MSEKWAQECAKYEERGTADYVKAALVYERQYEKGWSAERMAEAVADAGFRVAAMTIRRRLEALSMARATNARSNSKAFLEAFEDAYAEINRRARGGQTPLDTETRIRVYLEGVVGEFERLFASDEMPELDESELANIRRLRDHCDAVLSGRPVLRLVEEAG